MANQLDGMGERAKKATDKKIGEHKAKAEEGK